MLGLVGADRADVFSGLPYFESDDPRDVGQDDLASKLTST